MTRPETQQFVALLREIASGDLSHHHQQGRMQQREAGSDHQARSACWERNTGHQVAKLDLSEVVRVRESVLRVVFAWLGAVTPFAAWPFP